MICESLALLTKKREMMRFRRRLIVQLLKYYSLPRCRIREHKTHNFNRPNREFNKSLSLSLFPQHGIYCRVLFYYCQGREREKVVGNCISRMMLSAIVKHDAISINNTLKWMRRARGTCILAINEFFYCRFM